MEYKLTILQWNANGLRSKLAELGLFLRLNKVHICLISETKLVPSDRIIIRNYRVHRTDMVNNSGGTAIFVHKSVPHTKINKIKSTIQNVGIKLANNTYIYSIYNSPRNVFNDAELDKFFNNQKTIMGGDFNARHTTWHNHINNTNGNNLRKYLDNTNKKLLIPPSHTHFPSNTATPTTIDLVLFHNINNISDITVATELHSDHNPLLYYLDDQIINNINTSIISYRNTNWKLFRDNLKSKTIINTNLATPAEIDDAVDVITNDIHQAINKHAQKITIDPFKPFNLPVRIKELIKNRNKTRRQHQRFPSQQTADQIKQMNSEIKREIRNHRVEIYNRKLESLNPNDNSLWRKIKQIKNFQQFIPTIQDNDNNQYFTNLDKAEAFSLHFQKINNINNTPTNNFQETVINTYNNFINNPPPALERAKLARILTSPNEIKNIIKKANNRKTPGADGISNIALKNIPTKTLVQLTNIINSIIKTNYFPTKWKTATVVPLPKPGKNKEFISSYRPISLTSILSKTTEKVILSRLHNINNKRQLIINEQFGFRPKHNTVMQLSRVINDITTQFNYGRSTVMSLLDIEKAFDTVWIPGLIYKLLQYNIPPNLIQFIHSFIINRKFYTKVGNDHSTIKEINAGIPQGSALGPVLYIYYINDIPMTNNTNIALFADDTAIYSHA